MGFSRFVVGLSYVYHEFKGRVYGSRVHDRASVTDIDDDGDDGETWELRSCWLSSWSSLWSGSQSGSWSSSLSSSLSGS